MKTMMMKSFMLAAMMSLSTAMFASTTTYRHNNKCTRVEVRHSRGCTAGMPGYHRDQKNCHCACHDVKLVCNHRNGQRHNSNCYVHVYGCGHASHNGYGHTDSRNKMSCPICAQHSNAHGNGSRGHNAPATIVTGRR